MLVFFGHEAPAMTSDAPSLLDLDLSNVAYAMRTGGEREDRHWS